MCIGLPGIDIDILFTAAHLLDNCIVHRYTINIYIDDEYVPTDVTLDVMSLCNKFDVESKVAEMLMRDAEEYYGNKNYMFNESVALAIIRGHSRLCQ